MKWRIVLVPFAFAVVSVVRAIAPWKLVRFGEIWSSRLGHLVGNTECYLSERDGSTFDLWHHVKPISHKLIAAKYSRILHTWPAWFGTLVIACNKLFGGWERHMAQSEQFDRDIRNRWRGTHIGFTKEENKEGERVLRRLGIPPGAKWVCLIVRDASYLKAHMPGANYGYHDHRDADIQDHLPAAIALAKRGYYVLRMGNVVATQLRPVHPKVIDYALSPHLSELGTLYLGAKCEFCFGTSTGFMAIPQVFQRPCAVTNFVPVEYISTFCRDLVIWKHHYKDGRELSFKEIIAAGVGQSTNKAEFDQAGVMLKDNTPVEIRDLALQMLDSTRDDQSEFWEAFPRSVSPYNGRPLHGEMLARVGRKFYARLQNHRAA